MSKQSEAKAKQGYISVLERACSNCAHFKRDRILPKMYVAGGRFDKEENKVDANLRCGLGGFAVKKMGTCNEFTDISNPSA
jgi:hypothetical protein